MTDKLLRMCLRAYPRGVRERDGEVLLDLARELVEGGSSPLRQAAGLVGGGAAARLRRRMAGASRLPWWEARSRLALPLAAALLALMLVGAERATDGVAWIGWSWVLGLAGSLAALAGAALGRRGITVLGALVVGSVLGLDAARDLYGAGSRWTIPAGTAEVDVLVMWIPAALLLAACAGAVRRVPAHEGASRLLWATVPGIALVVLSAQQPNTAEAVVGLAGFAAAAALVAWGLLRSDRPATLASALVLAAVAPSGLWLSAAWMPTSDAWGGLPSLVYFAVAGALVAAATLSLARFAQDGDA
jgi:hypothetical protein